MYTASRSDPLTLFTLFTVVLLSACFGSTEQDMERFCAKGVDCDPDDGGDGEWCVGILEKQAEYTEEAQPQCGRLFEGYVDCLSKLDTCDEIEDYWSGTTGDYPCSEEEQDWVDCCNS